MFGLEHMLICHAMPIKGMFHEGFIKAHIRSSSQENKRKRDWEIFLNDLRVELVAWLPAWLHDNKVLMYGVKKDPILLTGFRRIKGYSPVLVVRQFGRIHPILLTVDFP